MRFHLEADFTFTVFAAYKQRFLAGIRGQWNADNRLPAAFLGNDHHSLVTVTRFRSFLGGGGEIDMNDAAWHRLWLRQCRRCARPQEREEHQGKTFHLPVSLIV